jgi:hypothetical protein
MPAAAAKGRRAFGGPSTGMKSVPATRPVCMPLIGSSVQPPMSNPAGWLKLA